MSETLIQDVVGERREDGSIILSSVLDLGPVARSVGEWLDRWADEAPDRVFIAERSGEGWREMTFGEMRQQVGAVASALLARGMGRHTPIAFLSGAGVDHAVMSLAAQYVGVPVVPLAEQYSLIPEAHPRLVHALGKVKPAMVFTAKAAPYAAALDLEELDGVEKVAVDGQGARGPMTDFASLLTMTDAVAVDAAHGAVGPDDLAKILFTSGSTANPKGVPQTHGMLCVNQAQYLACLPILGKRPPRMLDWLPWNHVFAGNSNFNMMLANGGSLYLDDGKPTKALFGASLRNLHEHPGTLSFNVPIAFAMQVDAMRKDRDLRRKYFAELDMILYAGASLPPDVWQAIEQMAMEERGEIPLMTSSWGMTETAPCAIIRYQDGALPGMIGVPVPGLEAKLIPADAPDRYELRVRGINVMDGYYDEPEINREAFDEEGFFITGDAVRFVDADDMAAGLKFDGRLTEDFKLLTGTWVHASTLRLIALECLAGLVQDVVITGQDKGEVGLLIFPDSALMAGGVIGETDGEAVTDPAYLARIEERLTGLAAKATGSSTRIARALVLAVPPSVKDQEITAKGSLNVRRVLGHRGALVDRLYGEAADDPAIVRI